MSEPKGVFAPVASELDFPAEEARVAEFWSAERVFAKTLAAATRATGPSKGPFVFYEGPPTANGMPHNGHVLTRSIKDVVPRYKTMCGHDVPRKAGWDTHGLPVEVEVEKDLGIHGKAEIEKYGIKPFVQKCIESVFRYTEAWEKNTRQIGFWLDTDNAYVTYHQSYVESVWWALSELHRKGLLYRGHKVVWWWPQGGTALSAAEVGWNYKTVDDPSCYVALQLEGEPDTYLCVWTTTPWTLPSNGYAAVRGDVDYVVVEWHGGKKLVLAAALREALAKKIVAELPVTRELKGRDLVGKRYRPCFDTFARGLYDAKAFKKDGGEEPIYWRVLDEPFVTLDTGTGIVHIAPAFGEDDFNAHRRRLAEFAPIAGKEVPLICAVLPDGTFGPEAGPFAGMWIKDADPLIVKDLAARGLLVHHEKYRHDYPFCWRADDDPLIQLARPAWYIRTTDRIAAAIANNQQINWLPEHIKEGRFGDFLRNNVDWALSRERYWGTPLNVWCCDRCDAEVAPASTAEIEERNPRAFDAFRAAQKADPSLNEHLVVHKPWIDEVTFPCPAAAAGCAGTMRRVPEVIDCWFDSGSMPFAQHGFPHQPGSKEAFDRAWPADFISEAIDQTRGWFYSLLMISTLVFDDETCARHGLRPRPYPHPYKSCVVLGHVCDKEGKKESKSKGNYTPPDIILERVRMEFAVARAADHQLAVMDDQAFVAREDYEGLDFSGDEAVVRVYRGEDEASGITVRLKPATKTGTLPRRVVYLSRAVLEKLRLEPVAKPKEIKPNDVFRLASEARVFIEDPTRPAPGADAFRWFFYASSPPWTNTRHSLSNVRLLQKDFLVKLRNVYSFFVIYANIDGFDPHEAKARPVAERSELDRWITSEVALAVREVRRQLDGYGIYEAAQRLVEFVDALSNWYVRRSRDRFWASKDDATLAADKLDASFTLYESLVAVAKAIAPFVPFFAETMYQNLVRRADPSAPVSVHLCAYPEPDARAIDERLAGEMRAVRELVSLGLQVRSDNKLRVRQPLARADVVLSDRSLRLERYGALVAEELNVHEVRWLEPGEEAGAVEYRLKPNFRALGPRIGKKVQALKQALEKADAAKLHAELSQKGRVAVDIGGESIDLGKDELDIAVVAGACFAAAGGRAGVVVLHTELDDALRDEGLGRDVLARLQGRRKELALGFTERIRATVFGGERVRRIVEAQQGELARETLAVELRTAPLAEAPASLERTTIEGEDLAIDIARV